MLGGSFREMEPAVVLALLQPKLNFSNSETEQAIGQGTVVCRVSGRPLSPYDLKRLEVCVSWAACCLLFPEA
jgi:hypothetical protein